MPARSPIFVNFEPSLPNIVFHVFQSAFAGAPTRFIPPQTLIFHRAPAKIQLLASPRRQAANTFPHYEVVRAQFQSAFVRCAKLVNRLFSVKKNSSRHGNPFAPCQDENS